MDPNDFQLPAYAKDVSPSVSDESMESDDFFCVKATVLDEFHRDVGKEKKPGVEVGGSEKQGGGKVKGLKKKVGG